MADNEFAKREKLFFKKIKNDRKWYFDKFLRIRNKKAQIVPFVINPSQKIVMDLIEQCERDNVLKRFIVLKARQMGLSTLFEGIIFHDTANNELKNSMIIAHEESASSNLFNMSKLFYECLPDVIRPMKKYSNGRILSFENPTNDDDEKRAMPGLRSKITIATAGSGEVGRSATIHNLHASELAFFPDGKTTMLGLLQAVPDEMNTFVVLESTANGLGDYFHMMWQQAVRGISGFIPVFLPWFIDPNYKRPFTSSEEYNQFISEVAVTSRDDRGNKIHTYEYLLMEKHNLSYEQMNWRRHTIRTKCQGDEILFMQEYPATPEEAFISTGRPKFNIKALQRYSALVREPIRIGYLTYTQGSGTLFLEESKGYITIWEDPKVGRNYVIGADVAEGLAHGDYSACVVIDTETLDVVAKWHGHIDPDLFGEELVKLAIHYNEAYLGVENNNHGLTTLKSIQRKEYWNIFFTKSYDKIADKASKKMGWSTNGRTKPLAIDKLAEYVREHYIGIFDEMMITELSTYVIDDRGGTNAQEGSYDDLVMSLAIGLQLALENMGEDYTPENSDEYKKHDIVDKMFESESTSAIEVAE